MKTLLLFTLVSLSFYSVAQTPLTANAGSNLVICSTAEDGIEAHFIGGQPSATGGVPPYTYSWSFAYSPTGTSDTSYASDFFNDTSLANPTLVWMHLSNLTEFPRFVLTVTDSNGDTNQDSVQILLSSFIYHFANYYPYIYAGDSIFFTKDSDVFGGTGPSAYLWQPSHGLSDSTLRNFFYMKPDTSIQYYVIVTDSVGCSQRGKPDYINLTVFPTGIEAGLVNTNIKIYPNPASSYVQIERIANAQEEQFTLYDILGKQVLKILLNSNIQIIEVGSLARGNYTYVIGKSVGKIILK